MRFTRDECESLADLHFRGDRMRCPRCSARIEAEESNRLGEKTVSLFFTCARCGMIGSYTAEHLSVMDLRWTSLQKREILDQYWDSEWARCPNDDAVLSIDRIERLGVRETPIIAWCKKCGRSFCSTELDNEVDPETFKGRYEVIDELGRGGMGRVQLVRRRRDSKLFAAKQILPDYLKEASILRRFQREIRIAEGLRHPNIVPIYDTFLDETGGILVMEHLSGGTLTSAINSKSVATVDLAALIRELAVGLSFLHEQGVVHRDLKPDNVLIDGNGRAYISDFGLAALVERDTTSLTMTGKFLGTRHYAAPEQIEDAKHADYRADLYALAIICYEMITRKSPYSAPIRTVDDRAADKAITIALREDPIRREISACELAEAVALALETCGTRSPGKR